MNDHQERFMQALAFTLVVIGLMACGLGDHFHLSTLANGGTTAIGLGGGLLTGKALQQMTTKGGGPIVNSPPQDTTTQL